MPWPEMEFFLAVSLTSVSPRRATSRGFFETITLGFFFGRPGFRFTINGGSETGATPPGLDASLLLATVTTSSSAAAALLPVTQSKTMSALSETVESECASGLEFLRNLRRFRDANGTGSSDLSPWLRASPLMCRLILRRRLMPLFRMFVVS